MSSISELLQPLLGNYSHLKARIRHIDFDTEVCGEKIGVRGSYVSFRDGEATVDDFVEAISNHIAAFCLPRSQINDAYAKIKDQTPTQAMVVFTRLVQSAQALFIKAQKGSQRSGEAGEVILYILTEWLLEAPQIVSKMYLKTNFNMPVFGTDGIHARYCSKTNRLFVYWGESKAHKTLWGALDSALSSIKEFVTANKQKREIEIVSQYLDIGHAPESVKNAIVNYLDPYTEDSNLRVSVFACLLIFDFQYESSSSGLTPEQIEADFEERFREATKVFVNSVQKTTCDAGFAAKRFEFFLLPVPDVQALRDKFQAKIGWSNA